MVCSLSVIGTGQVKAAGAITHYNVDFIQETSTVAIANNLKVEAADANNDTVMTGGAVVLTCSDPNAILPTDTTLDRKRWRYSKLHDVFWNRWHPNSHSNRYSK